MFDALRESERLERRVRRRRFLAAISAGVTGLLLYRWWRDRPQPVSQRPTRYITPNRDFFTVSIKAGYPPMVDEGRMGFVGDLMVSTVTHAKVA